MHTLYARKEPTTDWMLARVPRSRLTAKHRDVVLYRDQEGKEAVARFPWYHVRSKPDRRKKNINLNCVRYSLVWLEDQNHAP